MKRVIRFVLVFMTCLLLAGCQSLLDSLKEKPKMSDEELVTALMTAFQEGNYTELQKYIEPSNRLHLMFSALDKENPTEMDKVYQEAHKQLSNVSYTVKSVEGKEAWGTVTVTVTNISFSEPLLTAMDNAIKEQAELGNDAFVNMPGWMMKGISNPEASQTYEFELNVVNRTDKDYKFISTSGGLTDDFWNAVTGDFYDYMLPSMTTATATDEEIIHIASFGDEVYGMVDTTYIPATDISEEAMTEEELNAVITASTEPYTDQEGVTAIAFMEDNIFHMALGINYLTASHYDLEQLELLSGSGGYMSYISLNSTISGLESSGMTCETNNFGFSMDDETD